MRRINLSAKLLRVMNSPISVDSARYRPGLLALAALSSFISATWVAADPQSMFKDWWGWDDKGVYTIPIAILSYLTFFLIFILKVVLEWRFEIHVPMRAEYACIGLTWSSQLVVVVLENVSNPGGEFWSSWGAVHLMSVVSLIALTVHILLPNFPFIWRIVGIVVLPERLREPNSIDAFSEEPLLPAYSVHPDENPEVRILGENEAGPDELSDIDPTGLQSHSNGSKATRKGKYILLLGDDLERGEAAASA
ncbi:unnamed protein product [Rhizoctonia solani]|uniref:Uncharacterized protein n=1 Tax=Rhizoctonia solani TaxID=456999 RepID=A0A8H3GRV9_9AGAM|nr:unnamed protein product [Rhizoctonia solani]